MEIGARIRNERERRGLSQEALAKAVGISQPAIKKIETGQTRKSKFLQDILDYLGMASPAGKMEAKHSPNPELPSIGPSFNEEAVRDVLTIVCWHYLQAIGLPDGPDVPQMAEALANTLLETVRVPPAGTLGVDRRAALRLRSDEIIRQFGSERH